MDQRATEARVAKGRTNVAIALRTMEELRAAEKEPSHGGEVARKRGETHPEQLRLNSEWEASNVPTMTEAEYQTQEMPGPSRMPVRAIAAAMGVSQGYAEWVRKGEVIPHPRHWSALARPGVSAG
jgi:hypothetical protein